MFIMHISSLLACIVLLASTVLVIWSKRNKGPGSCLGKFVGSVVLILSFLNILCIGYYGVKYWAQGSFERPMGMPMGMHMGMPMGMHKEMMEKMMPQMMDKMMGNTGEAGNTEKKDNVGTQKEDDHASHHPQ